MAFALTTREYVREYLRRYGLFQWVLAGPDYSRAVEYPLVTKLLHAEAGHTLLDVGVARRAEFARHAAEAGLRVTAADLRDDVGAELPDGTGIGLLRADARALELPDGAFDRITAISTLEHIPEGEDRAIAELARVLAPGGRMVVSVPFNPLRSGRISVRGESYGNRGDLVFFEHLYDETALTERIIGPALAAGLRLDARVNLAEPGWKASRAYYWDTRVRLWRELVVRPPWQTLLALLAPRFLRPAVIDDYGGDDWIGTPVVLAFAKLAA
jgi:SAM-dependent methyltransferase